MRLRMRSGRESSSLLACLLPGSAFMKYPTLGQLTDERAAWSQLWQLSTSSLSWKSNRIACLLLAWGEMQLQHAQLQSPIVAACPPATSTATPTPPATAPPPTPSLRDKCKYCDGEYVFLIYRCNYGRIWIPSPIHMQNQIVRQTWNLMRFCCKRRQLAEWTARGGEGRLRGVASAQLFAPFIVGRLAWSA